MNKIEILNQIKIDKRKRGEKSRQRGRKAASLGI